MPYIKKELRYKFDGKIDELNKTIEMETNDHTKRGTYNYCITRLVHNYIKYSGISYNTLSNITGILTDVKKEFERTIVSPYEDTKRNENGKIGILADERGLKK